jgi:hypothetical protein
MLGTAGAAIVTSGHEPVQGAQDQIQLIDQNVKVTSERGRGGGLSSNPESRVLGVLEASKFSSMWGNKGEHAQGRLRGLAVR